MLVILVVGSCAVPEAGVELDLDEGAQAITDPDGPPPTRTGPINPRPSGMRIDTNAGGRFIAIRWSCGGNAEVQRSYYQRDGGLWTAGDVSCNISSTTGMDLIPVTPDTPYCFKATASNSSGSEWSNVVCATSDIYREPPAAPTMTVTAKPGRIEIRGVDHADIESGYRLYRQRTNAAEWGPPIYTRGAVAGVDGAISYNDTAITSDTSYRYKLEAWHPWATSEAVKAVDSWPTLPDAPSDVHAATIEPTALVIAWTDRSSSEDGFRVVYSAPGYGTTTKTVDPNVTSKRITVGSGTTWTIRVIAFNEAGEATSPTITVDTPETTPVGPDLVPLTVALQPAHPSPNQGMTFNWQECNLGGTASSGARTLVRFDGQDVHDHGYDLAAGACVTRSISHAGVAAGSHKFEVWLDANNTVAEAFEGNNYGSHQFTVR